MREHVSSRFYGRIGWDGKIRLPDEFLDRVEDKTRPVDEEVFVYVALKKR